MKLWCLSDLHVTRSSAALEVPPGADLALVAGDVSDGFGASLDYLERCFSERIPVLWVPGNHEWFGEDIRNTRPATYEAACVAPGIYLLDDQMIEMAGIRFLGSTLWTDFDLHAQGDPVRRRAAMRVAAELPDFREIWMAPPEPGMLARHFTPKAALALHETSLAWVSSELRRPFDGQSVVISHHAPCRLSVGAAFEGDPRTPAFVSDLSPLIEECGPTLWLHGHTHFACDYTVTRRNGRDVRIVCNPRGFPGAENPRFDARLLIDLS